MGREPCGPTMGGDLRARLAEFTPGADVILHPGFGTTAEVALDQRHQHLQRAGDGMCDTWFYECRHRIFPPIFLSNLPDSHQRRLTPSMVLDPRVDACLAVLAVGVAAQGLAGDPAQL